jgi:Domain of unknown function (DUF4335)
MATEPTLIRRYTPPTCSLEIVAQQSPLSRWIGKVALKDLRFKLSFDDPRISDDDWVVLRGDRDQLEALNQVVGDYVQSFLTQPTPNLAATGLTIEQDIAAQTAIAATEVAVPTTGIALQPKGLLSHRLSLGSLANENSGDRLTLTSTQLADLATALDEYSAEAVSLPNLDRQVAWLPNTRKWSSPNWAGLAAGVLVTVGLGASLLNGLSNRSATPTTASQASSSDQRLAMQPPPGSTPSPTPSNPFTISPLASLPPGKNLPSPTGTTPTTPGKTPPTTGQSDVKPGPNSAPTIANTNGGRAEINIVTPPKPGAAAQPSASESKPDPTIVDNIGSAPEPATASAEAINGAVASRSAAAPQQKEGAARDAALSNLPSLTPAPITPRGEAQAAAVQSYFMQNWKPQKDLEQGLEYKLQLDANGTLQESTPLGTKSEELSQSVGIPAAVGTKIAPAAADGQPTTVRLFLKPTGEVQALPQNQ